MKLLAAFAGRVVFAAESRCIQLPDLIFNHPYADDFVTVNPAKVR